VLPVQLRMGTPEGRLSPAVPQVRLALLGQAPQGCVMRAAWWWIDRWRQSTAYTDMTAEEQGLYRNLLDEVWLREDCVIPDDQRILSRVSGDPEAWGRCGEKVLAWMKKVPGGWTHMTALEVIGQSVRRAANQKRYRDKHNNSSDNSVDNAADNKPDSPSPSPSPYKDLSLVGRKELPPLPPPPAERAEKATNDAINSLQLRLGALICQLSEHPNSRQMVPAWTREVTAYDRQDGTKVRGVADFRTVRSIDRLERSIADAEWHLAELEKGVKVGT
jgi:uncharacterized protein YdaU (DUF1376 family)